MADIRQCRQCFGDFYNFDLRESVNGKSYCAECTIERQEDQLAQAREKEAHAKEVQDLIGGQDSVTLVVGRSGVELTYHRQLLAYYSKFFDRAFYGGLAEPGKPKFELPDDAKRDITAFASWAYTGTVIIDPPENPHFDNNGFKKVEITLELARLWALGDFLDSPQFCNAVMKRLLEETEYLLTSPMLMEYIFGEDLEGSLLRQFALDSIQYLGPLSWTIEMANNDEERAAFWRTRDAWADYISLGGEIVRQVTLDGGFHSWKAHLRPNSRVHRHKYLLDESEILPVGLWLQRPH